jgi:hypothetical protein
MESAQRFTPPRPLARSRAPAKGLSRKERAVTANSRHHSGQIAGRRKHQDRFPTTPDELLRQIQAGEAPREVIELFSSLYRDALSAQSQATLLRLRGVPEEVTQDFQQVVAETFAKANFARFHRKDGLARQFRKYACGLIARQARKYLINLDRATRRFAKMFKATVRDYERNQRPRTQPTLSFEENMQLCWQVLVEFKPEQLSPSERIVHRALMGATTADAFDSPTRRNAVLSEMTGMSLGSVKKHFCAIHKRLTAERSRRLQERFDK